jgi:hypothetical protein
MIITTTETIALFHYVELPISINDAIISFFYQILFVYLFISSWPPPDMNFFSAVSYE